MSDHRTVSNALTVGLVLIGAIVLLIASVVWLRTAGITVATRDLDVYFWNVGGRLSVGNPVRLAGVRIGTVAEIRMAPRPEGMVPDEAHATQETVVWVRCAIDRSTAIRDSYLARLNVANVVGESYIEIVPVSDAGAPLAPGQALVGVSPLDPLDLLPAAGESLTELGTAAKQLNQALAEEDLTGELVAAAESIERAMTATAEVAHDLSRLMDDSSGDITATIERVSALTGDLTQVTRRLVELLDEEGLAGEVTVAVREVGTAASSMGKAAKGLEELLGDGDNVAALDETIDSIAATARSVERMSSEVEGLLLDKGGLEKAETTLDSALVATRNLEALTGRLTALIDGPLAEPAIISTLGGIQRASQDLSAAAQRVSQLLDEEHLGGAAARVLSNMERASTGLTEMADPETVRDVREAARLARQTSEDLEAAASALRELMVESSFTEDLADTVKALRAASEALGALSEQAQREGSPPAESVGGGLSAPGDE